MKNRNKLISICPKCLTVKELNRHHIYPRRVYKKKQYENHTLLICDDCHRDIESILPQRKLNKEEYQAIHFMWMRGIDVTVL